MKKKIALLLATVMVLSSLPMSVFAASTNNTSKNVTIKRERYTTGEGTTQTIAPPMLTINPRNVIEPVISGSSIEFEQIILELENAEWAFDTVKAPDTTTTNWQNITEDGRAGAQFQNAYSQQRETWATFMSEIAQTGPDSWMYAQTWTQAVNTNQVLPWQLTVSPGNPKQAIVKLAPIRRDELIHSDKKNSIYEIPLVVKGIREGEVKVIVDAEGTNISSGTYTFATVTSSSGASVASISEIESGRDNVTIRPIAIKETVAGTFRAGDEIVLQLNGNFQFKKDQKIWITSNLRMTPERYSLPLSDANYNNARDEVRFKLPSVYGNRVASNVDTIYISADNGENNREGLVIEPVDEDTDYGDIEMTIRGTRLTRETLKVGERVDWGFKFETTEDAPTILAGRVQNDFPIYHAGDEDALAYNETLVDEIQTEVATVRFQEMALDSWLSSRKLTFTLPEGVKFVDVEFDEINYIDASGTNALENFSMDNSANVGEITLSKDGRSISLLDIESTDDELAEFEMTAWVSAELGFAGDVTMEVYGAGVTYGEVPEVVVAKAITPITIESTTTDTNMGYQGIQTADITIKEAVAGTFLNDREVFVELDSVFGDQELGFADEGITYEIEGSELAIRNFRVNNGVVRFTIDRESKTDANAIIIRNVKIGSTRSVPYGSYNIAVSGPGFVTNYNDSSNTRIANLDYVPLFDINDSVLFLDYVNVITQTGTFDDTVKVSIGSTTCEINGVATEMDVAPYIQASSGSTMVPLRFVSLALGVDSVENPDSSSKIQFDPNSKTVTILAGSGNNMRAIQFQAGSTKMKIGNAELTMVSPSNQPVQAEIQDSRMFVPFRALGEGLGVPVTWDDATRSAIYNAK